MLVLPLVYFFFATFLPVTFAAPNTVLRPSQDDFYKPPDNYESATVGEVLKFRVTPHRLRTVYVPMNVKNSYQYMYRTTDAQGNPSYAVSLLIEPYNANNSRLMQYSIAEDSSSVDCPASYTFLYGASLDTIVGQAESLLIQAGLNEGWWVNTADYEGPTAAFTAGRMAGHAVLDAIRSALTLQDKTGLQSDCEIVMWGYSGGALATGWATALQPTYAPGLEKQILGAALGGFPANITNTLISVDGSVYSGFIPAGVFGLASQYPLITEYVKQNFPERFMWIINKARNSCLVLTISYMAYTQIFQGPHKIVKIGLDLIKEPDIANMLLNTTCGVDPTEVPKIPLFVYQGLKDQIVPVKSALDVYDSWCESGIDSFELNISNITRHISEAIIGSPAAFTWLKDRFAHKDNLTKGCKKTYRKTNLFYPGITRNTLELVEGIVKTIFGFHVGPSSASKREFVEGIDFDELIERKIVEQNSKFLDWAK